MWANQPGPHRKNVTHTIFFFYAVLLRCLPQFLSRKGPGHPFPPLGPTFFFFSSFFESKFCAYDDHKIFAFHSNEKLRSIQQELDNIYTAMIVTKIFAELLRRQHPPLAVVGQARLCFRVAHARYSTTCAKKSRAVQKK